MFWHWCLLNVSVDSLRVLLLVSWNLQKNIFLAVNIFLMERIVSTFFSCCFQCHCYQLVTKQKNFGSVFFFSIYELGELFLSPGCSVAIRLWSHSSSFSCFCHAVWCPNEGCWSQCVHSLYPSSYSFLILLWRLVIIIIIIITL